MTRLPTFHDGEQALQRRAGSFERLAAAGPRIMATALDEERQAFWRERPFVLLGACDASGQPWATLRHGPPGFVAMPAPDRVVIDAAPLAADPLGPLAPGARVGLLGIEPETRRRNRLNGVVETAAGLALRVEQSFGNCPRYIQPRRITTIGPAPVPGPVRHDPGLGAQAAALLATADTVFIASTYPAAPDDTDPCHGTDVSHRGGAPGFVHVRAELNVLRLPDYAGNNYFNTLGNLLREPRAGLLAIDWRCGDVAWIAATARLIDDPALLKHYPGALRVVQFDVTQSRHASAALQIRG